MILETLVIGVLGSPVLPLDTYVPEPVATVTVCPIDGIGSQAAIDTGALVLWTTEPAHWLAGHDTDGWDWIDEIPTGTYVVVECGQATGTYQVYGHEWHGHRGGSFPSWAYGGPDLVMQTCTGPGSSGEYGTGFSLLNRVSHDVGQR